MFNETAAVRDLPLISTPVSPALKVRKTLRSNRPRGTSLMTTGFISPPISFNTNSLNTEVVPPSTSDIDVKVYREGDFYMQDYQSEASTLTSPKFKNITWHFIPENPRFESPLMRRSPRGEKITSKEIKNRIELCNTIEKQINNKQTT